MLTHAIPRLIMLAILALLGFNLYVVLLNPGGMQYEASQASLLISKLFADGLPMYESGQPESSSPYSLLYGPLMFLPGAILYELGFGTGAQQVLAALGWIATVFLVLAILPARRERWVLAGWLLWPIFVSLIFFAPRADPLWVLLPALAALLISRGYHIFWGVCLAAAATNIKLHSVLYFLPMLPVYIWRRGLSLRDITGGIVLFAAVALAPFAIPGIDLRSYLEWISLSAVHAVNYATFVGNVLAYLSVGLPLVALIDWKQIRATRLWVVPATLLALLVTGLIVALPASKVGASAYHFFPLVGAAALLLSVSPINPAAGNFLKLLGILTVLFLVVFGTYRAYVRFQIAEESSVTMEQFDQVAGELGGYQNVAVAPGDTQSRSRILLMYSIERGSPFVVNDVQLWDYTASGLSLPQSFFTRLERCEVPHFVVGREESPFGGKSLYTNDTLIPRAEAVFRRHYELVNRLDNLDVWACSNEHKLARNFAAD